MPLMRSTRATATVLALATALVCGCSGASKNELHVYNWADYIGKDTIPDFEAATGIKVIYDTYDADETLEAKMMAGDAGYDIVSTSTDYFSRQIKAGLSDDQHTLYPQIEHDFAALIGSRT